jgi:magnesium chelatase family protein
MRVYSFVRHGYGLQPIEVEVSLLPGVPQMQIVGQPDAMIRESAYRIRSAIKAQGFKWPLHQKIIVNLRPNYLKKTSRGLDLAIALAYLDKSGQIPELNEKRTEKEIFAYGDIGLNGDIDVPDDLIALFDHPSERPILTGIPKGRLPFNLLMAEGLVDIKNPIESRTSKDKVIVPRPLLSDLEFDSVTARKLAIVALGGHATLLAGPAGSGKTTFAQMVHELLPDLLDEDLLRLKYTASLFRQNLDWRPLVNPHHTISSIAMIGGGSNLFPGELSRAHGGLLIMDEFLEFSDTVKEVLREPLESGSITVTRNGVACEFPAKFRLIATTNLCPCGDKTPKEAYVCNYNLQRCRSVIQRMSGPLLDRFQIIIYTTKKGFSSVGSNDQPIKMLQIYETITKSRSFVDKSRPWQKQENARLPLAQLLKCMDPIVREAMIPQSVTSQRRKKALLAVARTIADIDGVELVGAKQLKEALQLAHTPFLEWSQL